MHGLLVQFRSRKGWRTAARAFFGGSGSYGNGAAMRVAPLGAYFADDLTLAAEQAALSAEVTHTHPEGIAGAVAVAVAAARAAREREGGVTSTPEAFLDDVLRYVPASAVRNGIERGRDIAAGTAAEYVAIELGNGVFVSAQDTVPFALWCAAHNLNSYEEALWTTVRGLGDRDTNCAIVGGIVACATRAEAIPAEWRTSREALPTWHLESQPEAPRAARRTSQRHA